MGKKETEKKGTADSGQKFASVYSAFLTQEVNQQATDDFSSILVKTTHRPVQNTYFKQRASKTQTRSPSKRKAGGNVKCNSAMWHALNQRECAGKMIKCAYQVWKQRKQMCRSATVSSLCAIQQERRKREYPCSLTPQAAKGKRNQQARSMVRPRHESRLFPTKEP